MRVYPSTLARIKRIVLFELEQEGKTLKNGDVVDEAIEALIEKKGYTF